LRADENFFQIIKKIGKKLIPLKNEIINYSYGIKPEKVKFFYINDKIIKHFKIEKRFIKNIITTTKDVTTIGIKPDSKIFYCHLPKEKLKNTGALNYIKYEKMKEMDKGSSVEFTNRFGILLKARS